MALARDITPSDVRGVYRLVGDCRDLGQDCSDWQGRLMDRLRELVGAQVVIVGNTLHFRPGRTPQSVSVMRSGWRDAAAERTWVDYASTVPLTRTPEYTRVAGFTGPLVTLTRDEIWDKTSWYRSQTFNDRHRGAGIDHYIMSIHSVPKWDLYHSLWVHRAVGDKPFSKREREMVHLLHAELGRMIGGPLAAAVEPGLTGLTRRQKDVLLRMLLGESEKQVASALGLSATTVHEYISALYKHFNVMSRGELMAKIIGRGVPPGFEPTP